jgi:transposase InsO family protein
MSYRFIDAKKAEYPVSRLCRLLSVSPSGYHAWKGRTMSPRRRQDMVVSVHMRAAFEMSHQTYGSPRMTHELRAQGFAVGRRRIARLMRESGLKARQKRRFARTTDSAHGLPVAPNLIAQCFDANRPNQKWGADITYVWTRQGWLYLAVVIDLYARRIIGWAVSDRLHADLALSALDKALTMRPVHPGLIHHSDRGSQYCANAYQARLRANAIAISMSGKGNAYDNAMVESFFKTLKTELIWRTRFSTRAEAARAIARYIDHFYNPSRRHSALGYISPVQFERLAGS